MDVGTLNGWRADQVVPAAEILSLISAAHAVEAIEPAYRGEVALRYRYTDGGGEIGIISSVTAPFCGDCTRARLSSDGRLITCLFAADGRDLKTPMRDGADDDTLRALMTGVWSARTDRYSELRFEQQKDEHPRDRKKIQMYEIGG
jgi:cyclic pyranopterin phosphate synthase